jgi:hypothetical protein
MPPDSAERLVTIIGEPETTSVALELIVEKAGGRAPDDDAKNKMKVPNRAAGHIIGKSGATIKALCDESGARISICKQVRRK